MSFTLWSSVSLDFVWFSFISFPLCLWKTVRGRKCIPICSSNWALLCFSHTVFYSFINFANHRLQISFCCFFSLSLSLTADGKGTAIHYSDSTSSFIMEGDAFQNASLSRDKWNQSKIWSPARPEGCRNSSQHMAGFNWFYTHFEMNEWVLFAVCLKEINATISSFLLRRVCLPL